MGHGEYDHDTWQNLRPETKCHAGNGGPYVVDKVPARRIALASGASAPRALRFSSVSCSPIAGNSEIQV